MLVVKAARRQRLQELLLSVPRQEWLGAKKTGSSAKAKAIVAM